MKQYRRPPSIEQKLTCPKCFEPKQPNKPYCTDCINLYNRNRNKRLSVDNPEWYCSLCYRKKRASQPYCYTCRTKMLPPRYIPKSKVSPSYDINDPIITHLVEFVNRIESRNGYCSFEEIFLELITLYNSLTNEYFYGTVTHQITQMWLFLKNIKNNLIYP